MSEIICILDVETTGFDIDNDEVTEIAWVIKRHGATRPLANFCAYVPGTVEIPEEVQGLTHITDSMRNEYGIDPPKLYDLLSAHLTKYKVKYFAAHNGNDFDRHFVNRLFPKLKEEHANIPWIDTLTEMPWPDSFRCLQLGHIAAEFGFLNPFPHNALADVWTTAKIMDQFSWEEILKLHNSPTLIVRANVSYDDRNLAKDKRFRWETIGDKKYPKQWVKKMKAIHYAEEKMTYDFQTEVVEKWA